MSSSKRMIYQMSVPDIAVGPGPVPLGSIAGKGVLVPVVDCPMPRHGNRSPLMVCMECAKLGDVGLHHIECGHQVTPQELAEMKRKTGMPPPGPPQGQPQGAGQHPGVQPPVPPSNVFTPKS